jgi:aspartate kinase
MTPWWPPASRSPRACWRSRCRAWASRPAPGRAGRSDQDQRCARLGADLEIDGTEIINRFKDRKEVAVIAGFQGINPQTEPNHHARARRLGHLGGGDRGRDPCRPLRHLYRRRRRLHHRPARGSEGARLDKIAFEDMLELASQGAKVLQVRSVELGMVHNMPVFVRSSFDKPEDIDPHANQPPGTLICSEEEIMESHVVTGIAFSKDEAQISVRQIEDKPGVAAAIFGPLADANINVDMIVQNVSEDGKTTDLTFTVPASDYTRARDTITASKGQDRLQSGSTAPPTWRKSPVIGSGMRSHAGVAAKGFKALSERNINIRAITTSEIKFSVLIDAAYTELCGAHAAHALRARPDLERFSLEFAHGLIARPAAVWQIMRFAGAASAMTHTLLVLAGVLLGKTSLDWLYGL